MNDPVFVAQAKATLARERLSATIAALTARLAPRALAADAVETVGDTARQHPIKIAGAAAAVGLFLARRPIARLLASDRTAATPPPVTSLTKSRARRKSQ